MSITFEIRDYGMYHVIADGIPDYPIAYLRLCYDIYTKKYGIVETCDTKKEFEGHRKIIVVGMRIGKDVVEQSFYLSTGLNSIESMEKFFEIKLNSEMTSLWIPFTGLGYPDRLQTKDSDIKLLKSGFGCITKSPSCLYGRFGVAEPNLIQISYCLGGKFWENNIKIINDASGFGIKEYPMINTEKLPCCFVYEGGSEYLYKNDDVACSMYINNYIASAIAVNYQTGEAYDFKKRMKTHFAFGKIFKEFENVKADFRILLILYHKFPGELVGFLKYLPVELTFYVFNFWQNYYDLLKRLKEKEPEYYENYIIPIINETIPNTKIDMTTAEYNKWAREVEVIKMEPVSFLPKVASVPIELPIVATTALKPKKVSVKTIPLEATLGTKENPHPAYRNAKKGEYYLHKTEGIKIK
jgi:hypothetical protein